MEGHVYTLAQIKDGTGFAAGARFLALHDGQPYPAEHRAAVFYDHLSKIVEHFPQAFVADDGEQEISGADAVDFLVPWLHDANGLIDGHIPPPGTEAQLRAALSDLLPFARSRGEDLHENMLELQDDPDLVVAAVEAQQHHEDCEAAVNAAEALLAEGAAPEATN